MVSNGCDELTMRKIIENSRHQAAASCWKRAQDASRMRNLMIREGRPEQARICSAIKKDAIRRALQIAPENVEMGIDGDYQIGLLRVRYKDGTMLHLPWDGVSSGEHWDGTAA